LKTEEAHIVAEMREYFDQAKEKVGGIRFAQESLWSKIENRVDVWLTDVCGDRHLRIDLTPRAKDAILHRFRTLLAKTIRESLGCQLRAEPGTPIANRRRRRRPRPIIVLQGGKP
jgi:hypothetical protein